MNALRRVDVRIKMPCFVAFCILVFHLSGLAELVACLLTCALFAALAGVRGKAFAKTLLPLAVVLVTTLIMQILGMQDGEALVIIGGLRVTERALIVSATMMLRLLCLVLSSLAFMRCTTPEELVRFFVWVITPLSRLGARTDAFVLSMTVAFRFIPVLVEDFERLKRALASRGGDFEAGGVKEKLESYSRLLPALLRSSLRRADTLAEAFVSRCF